MLPYVKVGSCGKGNDGTGKRKEGNDVGVRKNPRVVDRGMIGIQTRIPLRYIYTTNVYEKSPILLDE